MLLVGEFARRVSIEVERTEASRADLHREPEHCPNSCRERGFRECRPSNATWIGKVCFQHRAVVAVGIDTGTFPEVELELLDERAHLVARADRTARDVARHQHDSRARQLRDVRAYDAQALRFEVTFENDPLEYLQAPRPRHRLPRSLR